MNHIAKIKIEDREITIRMNDASRKMIEILVDQAPGVLIRQVDLAEKVDISPSYTNQLLRGFYYESQLLKVQLFRQHRINNKFEVEALFSKEDITWIEPDGK